MKYFFKLTILLIIAFFLPVITQAVLTAPTQSIEVEATATVLPQGVVPPISDTQAPMILKVEIRDITTNSALIYWETSEFSTSAVDYGLTSDYELGIIIDKTNSLWTAHQILLEGLEPGTTYHFRIRSTDNFGNQVISRDYTFTTLSLPDNIPPANVRNFKAEGRDKEILLSWLNPDDSDFVGVRIERSEDGFPLNPGEGFLVYRGDYNPLTPFIKGEFLDENLINGKRYYYTIWAYDEAGNFSSGALASAIPTPQVLPLEEVPEIIPGIPVEEIEKIKLIERIGPISPKDVHFFLDYGLLKLQLIENKVRLFPGSSLTLSIPQERFSEPVKMIQVVIDNQVYLLRLNKEKRLYEGIIKLSEIPGEDPLIFVIIYEDGRIEVMTITVKVEVWGSVYEAKKPQATGYKLKIPEAIVTLYQYDNETGEWETWDGDKYNQKNPQITDENGEYGFMVPDGKYYLIISKDGYLTKKTREFEVKNNIINLEIGLISSKKAVKYWEWTGIGVLGFIILAALAFILNIFRQFLKITF